MHILSSPLIKGLDLHLKRRPSAANILNKQSWAAEKGRFSTLGFQGDLNNPHLKSQHIAE